MDVRQLCGAAVGGALVLTLSVSPPAAGRSGDLGPGCPGLDGTAAGTTRMPGMAGMAGMREMVTGSEAEYLAEMILHHEEAVTAARELQRSARTSMRELGASIVAGQTAEIRRMRAWLALWHPGTTPSTDDRTMVRDLRGLEGDALDRAFLEDMIPHHMMAVMTSQQLLRRHLSTHDEVADLAAHIRDDQWTEIRTMRGLLDQLPGTTPGGPMLRHPADGRMQR